MPTWSMVVFFPRSSSHHGSFEFSFVWVWPPAAKVGFLFPSVAREASPPKPVLDWVAFPVGAIFLPPLMTSTSARVRVRWSPERSTRT